MDEKQEGTLSVKYGDFLRWIDDPVTQTLFAYLRNCIEGSQSKRLSPVYLKDKDGLLKLNELYGYERALHEVLNIEQAITEENNEDEANSTDVEVNS